MTNSGTDAAPAAGAGPAAGWRWAPAWVLAYVAMWPAPGIAEGLLSLGALLVLAKSVAGRLRREAPLLDGAAWRLASALFLAYWLPQLLSAPDAIDGGRAWGKAALGLRYLPFAWLVAMAVATPPLRRLTFGGLAVIVAAWFADGLLQALSGTSAWFWSLDQLKWAISGHGLCTPAEVAAADRLSGFLGPCNLKLGQVLASMSPFLLLPVQRRWGAWAWLAVAALAGIVIVLAGSRASWITYALVLLLSGWPLLGWKRLLAVAVVAALGLAGLVAVSPQLQQRVQRTTLAFADGGMDQALSGRGQIWGAAACMIAGHPVNGVGARGFREAFPACDPLHGSGPAWGEGPALHAHQLVLEILSETGILGLLLWLSGAWLAWRAWHRADAAARERARPTMLALVVTVFPFNTHLAFHSSFWGGVLMLLAGLYAGALKGWSAGIRDDQPFGC
ncbi:O-antigen ligase family protein [Stenotrophomonas sp. MMGLT7]|uniref:O-antigen ligase family protein n=1 Tax=Stenotrophomonas sp. MMGLT7 TaxID=2901227 RepID=UPI001E28EE58|nr:O-antigen ligase family protein [Stenotrophomonas sp. MMGLT7]MCD7097693.1 O-antigen ligase family protein [Stenotrophomonas sp. MMGLT7]